MNKKLQTLLLPGAALALLCACAAETDSQDRAPTLSVLTLNLHTYQELQTEGIDESQLTNELARRRVAGYAPIFDRIAAGIETLSPDVICLQEVGEWREGAGGDDRFGSSDSNMAGQVLSRLPAHGYEVTMDWSHIGFGVWREGAAILSRHPMLLTDARYVSRHENSRRDFWKSRNVPKARIDVPGFGEVDVYSVHLGWWDDLEEPFAEQWDRLLAWIAEDPGDVVVLCGDFNVAAGGPGYSMITTESGFDDAYLLANPGGMFDATIAGGADGWEDAAQGRRIDYVLVNDDSGMQVTGARRVFTSAGFGQVSDHLGVYVTLARRQ
ncbi:MAG: endonuclease/exonuclease/phosphatase family protein [Woeseiaceae bacterium]|nr:endonuclease/exonuclease/phosphatase family protein [Woeseiaceae bacterium]